MPLSSVVYGGGGQLDVKNQSRKLIDKTRDLNINSVQLQHSGAVPAATYHITRWWICTLMWCLCPCVKRLSCLIHPF